MLAAGVVGAFIGFGAGLYLAEKRPPRLPKPAAPVVYIPTSFAALPGWGDDRISEALPALNASCRVLADKQPTEEIGTGTISRPASAWQHACAGLAGASDDADVRRRLEQLFVPYAVVAPGKNGGQTPDGLFTGYYEADLTGSLTRQGRFQIPIYGVPRDLVTVDLRQFVPDLPATAPRQLVGHVSSGPIGNMLVPYFTRKQIDHDHVLDDKADVLLWADDPVAVHILHIQGSGRVTLQDGRQIHIGFAGHNGLTFHGIGGILIAAGVLKPGEASMDRVRDWLHAHPVDAARYMDENARYIFFRINPSSGNDNGPPGALGVALSAGRSLAVDPRFVPLGAPLWLDTADADGVPIRRLVAAQDMGAAILGPVRGDLFWGHGEKAFAMAARMHSTGHYFVLIPIP